MSNTSIKTGKLIDPIWWHILKSNRRRLRLFGSRCVLAIVLIVVSLTGIIFWEIDPTPDGISNFGNGCLLLAGLLILIDAISSFWSFLVNQRYWHQLRPRRSLSIKDPIRFLAQIQPAPGIVPPQPGKSRFRINRLNIFIDRFIFVAIISFLVPEVVFRQTGFYLWLTVFWAVFVALVGAIADVVLSNKRNWHQLEVCPDGLALQVGASRWQINWQDVRRFTRYRALPLGRGLPEPYLYELAGDSISVRWYWLNPLRAIKFDPPMTADEYEHWMTQLTGYVIERTGLPLLDLDEDNQRSEEPV